MNQITYEDKIAISTDSSIADVNKFTADDFNEIKSVVNNNASKTYTKTETDTLLENKQDTLTAGTGIGLDNDTINITSPTARTDVNNNFSTDQTINGNVYAQTYSGYTLDFATANTTDTWVPVLNGSKIQYRVLPTSLNNGTATNLNGGYLYANNFFLYSLDGLNAQGRYYKLAYIPRDDGSSNCYFVNINGHIGNWTTQKGTIDLQISNRNGLNVYGNYFGANPFNSQTIKIYQESDGGHTIYLYNVSTYTGPNTLFIRTGGYKSSSPTIYTDYSYTTSPSGTLVFTGSELNIPKVVGVVESGTSGIWTYKKYSDGTAECWGTLEVSTALATTWGSMYTGTKQGGIAYPFTFSSIPNEQVTLNSGEYACWVYAEKGRNTTTQTGYYNACRPSKQSTESTIYYNFYVRGTY